MTIIVRISDSLRVTIVSNRMEVKKTMANSNGSNQINVPQARQALNNMKYEIARELGVNLKQGYNGDLTSKQAGSVGGQMVNNMTPVRLTKFERENRIVQGHKTTVKYTYSLTI